MVGPFFIEACTIQRISMLISGSCLPKPVKCPRKPLIALPDWPRLGLLQTLKLRSYPTNINEGTTIAIMGSMNFCNFKSCPLDTRSDMVVEIETIICTVRFPTVFRYTEGTTPTPIPVYGQKGYFFMKAWSENDNDHFLINRPPCLKPTLLAMSSDQKTCSYSLKIILAQGPAVMRLTRIRWVILFCPHIGDIADVSAILYSDGKVDIIHDF